MTTKNDGKINQTPSLAVKTIARFLGISPSESSFKELARIFEEKGADPHRRVDILTDPAGQWSIDDLVARADSALNALSQCVHQSRSHIKTWGDSANQKEWAGLRSFGPILTSSNGWVKAGKIDYPGFFPRFVLSCFDRLESFKSERAKGLNKSWFLFVAAERLDAFPPGVLPIGSGFPYVCWFVHLFDDGPVSTQYFFTLDRDGRVHNAKTLRRKTSAVRTRRRNQIVHIPSSEWVESDPLGLIHKEEGAEKPLSSADAVCMAFNRWFDIDGSVIAQISDDRGRVNVPIKTEDAKVLFSKREKAKTKDGRTRPIIHWVSSHTRKTGSSVKTHWRGLREFVWKGLDVNIMMPGKEGELLSRVKMIRPSGVKKESCFMAKIINITNACGEDVEFSIAENDSQLSSVYYRSKEYSRGLH